jgi:3'-phosphoadenosine 5'-phosphosulfate sulfotransferase (PAPS reductase)/FAD synthetase
MELPILDLCGSHDDKRVDIGTEDGVLAYTDEVNACILADDPIAIGVSGGKDSCAVALATAAALDEKGHNGERILIHADLGRTEWKDSLPTCQRLADRLDMELVVVKRAKGDMMDRWLQRWDDNVKRYAELSCVRLILPWSTPAMRFCTSELKIQVICRYLAMERFAGRTILNVTGIRGGESANRAAAPISARMPALTRVTKGSSGFQWNPIHPWSTRYIYQYLKDQNFELHEAYREHRTSRVSCCFCILGKKSDLRAAAGCEDNHDLYREMVDLEIRSTFGFQDSQWLGDVAPELLTAGNQIALPMAKEAAAVRAWWEAKIPKDLNYKKGWPQRMPTPAEATLIASVRKMVAETVGLVNMQCTTPLAVLDRYSVLMKLKADKETERDRKKGL